MELFAADGHDASGCERVTGKSGMRPAAKKRFLQEAQAASAQDHPNICNIHEINETEEGQLYLVMAHYEGETLKEWIERGPLPLENATDIATQVGQGLAEAHAAGIVHRDIKPASLTLNQVRFYVNKGEKPVVQVVRQESRTPTERLFR